jgi:hypothetical protein
LTCHSGGDTSILTMWTGVELRDRPCLACARSLVLSPAPQTEQNRNIQVLYIYVY